MGECVQLSAIRGRLRLKRVNGAQRTVADVVGGLLHCVPGRDLISPPNAAMCNGLREQTKQLLATLTPYEQQVLRMRFGIGDARHHTLEEISTEVALAQRQILDVEAQALRKLRSPRRPLTGQAC